MDSIKFSFHLYGSVSLAIPTRLTRPYLESLQTKKNMERKPLNARFLAFRVREFLF